MVYGAEASRMRRGEPQSHYPATTEDGYLVRNLKATLIKAAVIVLGLTPILSAQDQAAASGPQYCPPLEPFLTPTLLDVLIYPGMTFR